MAEIKIVLKDLTTKAITGKVYNLTLGGTTLKVFAHESQNHVNCKTITEYKTGMRMFDITAFELVKYNKLTERNIAQAMLDNLVNTHGIERVRTIINSAKVIN